MQNESNRINTEPTPPEVPAAASAEPENEETESIPVGSAVFLSSTAPDFWDF